MRKVLLIATVLLSFGCTTSTDGVKDGVKKSTVEFLNSSEVLSAELPFSEATRVGNTLYLSGQIGIVPATRKLASGGIRQEAKQAMDNIKMSLERHGYLMSNIVKCTVMLADISEWGVFNEVYKLYFSRPYPARSAFAASGLALDARVEIECIAATDI